MCNHTTTPTPNQLETIVVNDVRDYTTFHLTTTQVGSNERSRTTSI